MPHTTRVLDMKKRLTGLFFFSLALQILAGCGGKFDADKQFCLDETNRHRSANGKSALKRSSVLEVFADEGAQVDAQKKEPHSHFKAKNGGGVARAENEIPGWMGWTLDAFKDNRAIIQKGLQVMMDEGPGGGHYENILGAYTELGCGIYVNGKEVTVVQDFH